MTTPIYDPGVPERPSDSYSTSQPEFLANFISLYQAFLKNHQPISGTNQGVHTILELLQQTGDAQTDLNEISFYSKNVDGQTAQVFVRINNNGTAYQLTNYQIYSLNQVANQTSYFTVLPGKFLVYFGSFTSLTNNILNLNPPIAKNIVGLDFTPIGTTPNYKPVVNPIKEANGEINKLQVTSANLRNTGLGTAPACYYFVVVNI